MSLTVKQLNADASFLLTFEPILPNPPVGIQPEPFRILMDPWITGPSTIFHSMLSYTTHKEPPCIASLSELPEPDLVIISQHKSDHCNEATLRQLPPRGTKTLILAEPAAARVIRSWRYFDKEKVKTIPRWEAVPGRQIVLRVKVPPLVPGWEHGEVSVAFIPQKRDIKGLHAAVGITYRPPPYKRFFSRALLTPPATPNSHRSGASIGAGANATRFLLAHPQHQPSLSQGASALLLSPPTPPSSPSLQSLRSVRSTASLSPQARERTVSVIFSPHGISFRSLQSYAAAHLAAEAALPLTALLHCFDAVSNPWWLGGNITSGMPAGQETASALGAKAWVSTHDGDKDIKGLVTKMLRTRKYAKEEVAETVSPRAASFKNETAQALSNSQKSMPASSNEADKDGKKGTEVLVLGIGEQVALTSEGVWNTEQESHGSTSLGLLEGIERLPSLDEMMTSE